MRQFGCPLGIELMLEETPRTPKLNRGKMQSVDLPLHWVLLLSKDTADLDTALTALHWYELRWRIERFFHTLKQRVDYR